MKKLEEQNIQVSLPQNLPILYTDMVFMNVNEDGVIIDVCQKGAGQNQFQVVSRIGMSKDHAKKFVKKLSEILALTTAHSKSGDSEN
ncbi:MAG: hypothetical protein ACM3IJ_03280 [Candidatus Levyibacteriota bacterium]